MDPLRPARPGETVQIPAATWNALIAKLQSTGAPRQQRRRTKQETGGFIVTAFEDLEPYTAVSLVQIGQAPHAIKARANQPAFFTPAGGVQQGEQFALSFVGPVLADSSVEAGDWLIADGSGVLRKVDSVYHLAAQTQQSVATCLVRLDSDYVLGRAAVTGAGRFLSDVQTGFWDNQEPIRGRQDGRYYVRDFAFEGYPDNWTP